MLFSFLVLYIMLEVVWKLLYALRVFRF